MIQTDLTEVLKPYSDWDDLVKKRHLQYAEKLIQQHTFIVYKGIEYRLLADLECDLNAECFEAKHNKKYKR